MTALRRLALPGMLLLAGCDQEASTSPADAKAKAQVAAAPRPAASRDWTQTVSATPDGGFVMGNPAAKVKVVEYGSLTCPHCGAFARESAPRLIANYVKPGLASFEFRNFARDPIDLAASLLVRCGGPATFYPMLDQLYADQDKWLARYQSMSQAESARISALPPGPMMAELARLGGLDRFVGMRGIPPAKARACLADEAGQKRIAEIRGTATSKFDVQGTPTFLINGAKADGVFDWATMEPQLKAALGS